MNFMKYVINMEKRKWNNKRLYNIYKRTSRK